MSQPFLIRGEKGEWRNPSYDRRFDSDPQNGYWKSSACTEIRTLAHLTSKEVTDDLIDITGDDWTWQRLTVFYRAARYAALNMTIEERKTVTAEQLAELANKKETDTCQP